MKLKERIGEFLQSLLTGYGLKQKELADALEISLGSLTAYLHGKELPRLEVIIKIADLGGVTLDDLLKTDMPPAAKVISIKTGARGVVVENNTGNMQIDTGDHYHNTLVRKAYKYTYETGDFTEEQAAKIQDLVNQVVELEAQIRKQPRTHAAGYGAMRKHFKVPIIAR
jgi:transcriptional regulator with XRE-family HTH domain